MFDTNWASLEFFNKIKGTVVLVENNNNICYLLISVESFDMKKTIVEENDINIEEMIIILLQKMKNKLTPY